MTLPHVTSTAGRPTFLCRGICSALLAAPLLYWLSFAYKGNAYVLLFLVVLAVAAGLVLLANSIFCLVRYRNPQDLRLSLVFVLVSVIGVVAMPFYLPGFKM
jgi:hypothetical protein